MDDDLEILKALAAGVDLVGDDDDDLLDLIGDDDDDDDDDDLIGASEIIAGATDFVGARRRRRKRGGLAARLRKARKVKAVAALARAGKAAKVERQGVRTIRDTGDRARRVFAGTREIFTTPAAAAAARLTVRIQEDFRPDRLTLSIVQTLAGPPAGVALIPLAAVEITDVKIGTRSQFSSLDPIGADVLSPLFFANGGDLGLDTLQAGTDFSLFLSIVSTTGVAIDGANPVTARFTMQGRAMR